MVVKELAHVHCGRFLLQCIVGVARSRLIDSPSGAPTIDIFSTQVHEGNGQDDSAF